jgi:hypothetical protein
MRKDRGQRAEKISIGCNSAPATPIGEVFMPRRWATANAHAHHLRLVATSSPFGKEVTAKLSRRTKDSRFDPPRAQKIAFETNRFFRRVGVGSHGWRRREKLTQIHARDRYRRFRRSPRTLVWSATSSVTARTRLRLIVILTLRYGRRPSDWGKRPVGRPRSDTQAAFQSGIETGVIPMA